MRHISFKREARVFVAYFLGYNVLIAPILVGIFDGRALVQEVRYYTSRPDEAKAALAGLLGQDIPAAEAKAPDAVFVRNPFPHEEASIVIPKTGVWAPIVFSSSPKNRDMLKILEKGVGHYPESPRFDAKGVSIILGHSSAYPWYRGSYGSVFGLLNKLDPGDEFIVFYQGNRYVYRVNNTNIVVPKDFKVENPDNTQHLILMSCWPVGTNRKRIVVFSDLVSVHELGQREIYAQARQ